MYCLMRKHTPSMFLTDFRTQKYTGGIISRVGIFLTVTPDRPVVWLIFVQQRRADTMLQNFIYHSKKYTVSNKDKNEILLNVHINQNY